MLRSIERKVTSRMERLTKKIGDEYYSRFERLEDGTFAGVKSCIQKLGELEDLEEQGMLLKLPCKVGDIVYQITRNIISEYRILKIDVFGNGNMFFEWLCTNGIYINICGFDIDEIGKTVFLAKEEAEKKLAEVKKAGGLND